MEWVEFTGKNVAEALDIALDQFGTSSDNVDYEVIEKETNGLLGLFTAFPKKSISFCIRYPTTAVSTN